MDKEHDKRLELARLFPSLEGDVVAQALHAWRRLAAELCPLIGETGFCALYGRAVSLLPAGYGWLAAGQPMPSADAIVERLDSALSQHAEADARLGMLALLETFCGLLAGLIGTSLTIRLLNSAWQSASDQKNSQEHT